MKEKSATFASDGIKFLNGICKTSSFPYNGNGSIAEANELADSTGLIKRRHEEKIASCIDLPGKCDIRPDEDTGFFRVGKGNLEKAFLIVFIPGSQN